MTPEELKQLLDLLKKFYTFTVSDFEKWEIILSRLNINDYTSVVDYIDAVHEYFENGTVYETFGITPTN